MNCIYTQKIYIGHTYLKIRILHFYRNSNTSLHMPPKTGTSHQVYALSTWVSYVMTIRKNKEFWGKEIFVHLRIAVMIKYAFYLTPALFGVNLYLKVTIIKQKKSYKNS